MDLTSTHLLCKVYSIKINMSLQNYIFMLANKTSPK